MTDAIWDRESLHDDAGHELLRKEKCAAGRLRQTRHYARILGQSASPLYRELAEILRSCAPFSRCGSGACPQCTTALRRAFIDHVAHKFGTATNIMMVTVIPTSSRPLVDLAKFDINKARADLRNRLANAGQRTLPVVGALDISLNHYSGSRLATIWVDHWTLFFPNCDRNELRRRLQDVFFATELIRRPVRVRPIIRTPARAFSYALKNVFDEHHYIVTAASVKRRPGSSGKIDTTHPAFGELYFTLHRIGMRERLFFQNPPITIALRCDHTTTRTTDDAQNDAATAAVTRRHTT